MAAFISPSRFIASLDSPWQVTELFDCLPEVYFFAKDRAGRFVKMNRSLQELRGLRSDDQYIGKTDLDFHPRRLAEQYMAEDQRVMDSAQPLANQSWLVPDGVGVLKWFLSSKIPLLGKGGRVIGLAGVMRDFERTDELLKPYQRMEAVLRHVLANYGEKLEIPVLAGLVHLSVSQFDRRFKSLFQMTPQQYIRRVRLNAACQALVSTDLSIAEIAVDTGFSDQSFFTKQFRHILGMTPLGYRKTHRSKESPAG